jgi:hypothetical protein
MGLMTVGMSEMARGFTRNCGACGHKMSLHGHTSVPHIVQTVPTVAAEPPMQSGDWHTRRTPAPAQERASVEQLMTDEEFAAAKRQLLGM